MFFLRDIPEIMTKKGGKLKDGTAYTRYTIKETLLPDKLT